MPGEAIEVRGWPRWIRDTHLQTRAALQGYGVQHLLGADDPGPSVGRVVECAAEDREAEACALLDELGASGVALVLSQGVDRDGTRHLEERLLLTSLPSEAPGAARPPPAVTRAPPLARVAEEGEVVLEEEEAAVEQGGVDVEEGGVVLEHGEAVADERAVAAEEEPAAVTEAADVDAAAAAAAEEADAAAAATEAVAGEAVAAAEAVAEAVVAEAVAEAVVAEAVAAAVVAEAAVDAAEGGVVAEPAAGVSHREAATSTEAAAPAPPSAEDDAPAPPSAEDDAPEWLTAPPPDNPTTCVRCDDALVLRLEGVLPPQQLQHLSRQNTSLRADDGRLVVAYRRGGDTMLGAYRVALDSYRDRAYAAQRRVALAPNAGPPRRAGTLMDVVRRRRRELERR